jgi:mevalonate kinase
MFRKFPGKILLFGEYTIIAGSRALVLPFRKFSGCFELPGENLTPGILKSNEDLRGILNYLEMLEAKGDLPVEIHTSSFREKLGSGLFFNSTIPSAYGAGSSGAIVAAIFDAFGPAGTMDTPRDLAGLRMILGKMESYYHGTSSGIDPLCSYLDKPLLVDGDIIRKVNIPSPAAGSGFFLLDSGLSVETGPLVDYFNSRMKEPVFQEMIRHRMLPLVEQAIINFLEGDQHIKEDMATISAMQYDNFKQMIPEEIRDGWSYGLRSGTYYLKLCGSGGGGFLIAYASKLAAAMDQLKGFGARILSLDT